MLIRYPGQGESEESQVIFCQFLRFLRNNRGEIGVKSNVIYYFIF